MIALAQFRLCERFFDQPIEVILRALTPAHHQTTLPVEDDEGEGLLHGEDK